MLRFDVSRAQCAAFFVLATSNLRKLMQTVLFLPGARGSATFWQPVADRLPREWAKIRFAWPGLGNEPHDPTVNSMEDLVPLVNKEIKGPTDLVAQSMGCAVAARIALARPEVVRRLVLVATSGGLDMARFGASDWRPNYQKRFPNAAKWIVDQRAATHLPVEEITAPTLLIWGDCDPISPVAVGLHLQQRIAGSTLHVVAGGDHLLASTEADQAAGLIRRHLS
jgi:pimeloyl-ACP methyl ester carboxylesterase